MTDVLVAFVKEPRPGQVKTRLGRDLGSDLAAALYRSLAELELAQTRPEAAEYARRVYFAPAEAQAEIARWLPGETLVAQSGADLGARMARAFEEVLARGARRAVIVGSDVPWVSRAHVRQALAALDAHDLALGPTGDGGYYLLGLARPLPELFESMPWSTPQVLPETLARAAALGLSVSRLEPLDDIDTLGDLRRAWARLGPLLEPGLRARLESALVAAGAS